MRAGAASAAGEESLSLVAAAVCPHPPLLVPELASGAAVELDDLRADCRRAVDELYAAAATVFVVGADLGPRARSFAPWGVDVAVDVPEPLPLPLLVGGWLTAGRHRSFVVVDPGLDPAGCAELGRELAASADRVALLVMGDGSARHSEKAPGYVDPAAAPWEQAVHAAFAAADPDALLALDPDQADRLLAAGRAPWQVLAGAARGAGQRTGLATLTAPYGVGYHFVTWR